MAAFIRLDLFPAEALVAGERFTPARVIVTDDTLYVYMDGQGGPRVAYETRLEDFTGRRTIGYTVTAADGQEVAINRASGCGCGSRLRGFHPFVGVPHIATS